MIISFVHDTEVLDMEKIIETVDRTTGFWRYCAHPVYTGKLCGNGVSYPCRSTVSINKRECSVHGPITAESRLKVQDILKPKDAHFAVHRRVYWHPSSNVTADSAVAQRHETCIMFPTPDIEVPPRRTEKSPYAEPKHLKRKSLHSAPKDPDYVPVDDNNDEDEEDDDDDDDDDDDYYREENNSLTQPTKKRKTSKEKSDDSSGLQALSDAIAEEEEEKEKTAVTKVVASLQPPPSQTKARPSIKERLLDELADRCDRAERHLSYTVEMLELCATFYDQSADVLRKEIVRIKEWMED